MVASKIEGQASSRRHGIMTQLHLQGACTDSPSEGCSSNWNARWPHDLVRQALRYDQLCATPIVPDGGLVGTQHHSEGQQQLTGCGIADRDSNTRAASHHRQPDRFTASAQDCDSSSQAAVIHCHASGSTKRGPRQDTRAWWSMSGSGG